MVDPGPGPREVERRPWRVKAPRSGPGASVNGRWAAGRRAGSASAAAKEGRLVAAAIRSWAAGRALGGVAAGQPC